MPDYESANTRRLRHAGYKLTNARVMVLQVLENSPGHITSADVLEWVHRMDDSIGRASVFRTLDLLTQLNIIRPTYIESSVTPHYVLLPDGHHHHIVCTNCNRTIEFHDCELEQVKARLEARFNVQITGHLLEFFGRCETCAAEISDIEAE